MKTEDCHEQCQITLKYEEAEMLRNVLSQWRHTEENLNPEPSDPGDISHREFETELSNQLDEYIDS